MHSDDRDLAAADPGLPALAVLLDRDALRRHLTTSWDVVDAEVNYLRYKPGVSMLAGMLLTRPDGRRVPAFAAAYPPGARSKIDKTLRRAAHAHAAARADRDGGLVVGEAAADRELPGIRTVRGAEPLVYKPGRRWVGLDRDAGVLLKVHRPRAAGRHAAAHRLLDPHLPTAELLDVDTRTGVVRTAYLPGVTMDDVEAGADTGADAGAGADARRAVGALLARLHAAPLPGALERPDRRRLLSAALDGLKAVAPDLTGQARAAAQQVLHVLDVRDGARGPALTHGDFSADQVVVRPDGTLTVIDLDRAGVDDPLVDLASWAAAELAGCAAEAGVGPTAATPHPATLLGEVLDGYRGAGGAVDDRVLLALTAGAVLQRATEPFRAHRTGWAEQVADLVTTARDLAAEAAAPGLTSAPAVPSAVPAGVAPRLPTGVRDGGTRWTVARAWPRGTDRALLELEDGTGRRSAAQWFAGPEDLADAARRAPAPARTVGQVLLQPEGADRRLPALVEVLDRPGASLVAHRPGRRAVVRVAGEPGTGYVEYVKVVRPSKAADLASRARRVLGLDAAVVPALLGADPAAGVLRFSAVGELTLLDAGADPRVGDAELADAWRRVGQVVTELHGLDQEGLPRHGVAEELAALEAWTVPAVHHGLLDPERVRAAAATVEEGLREESAPYLGVLHRDLHDKQVLLDGPGGRLGLIDVDTLAVGERALDVANLLVHLELRERQGLLTPDRAALARTSLRRGLPQEDRLWARVPAYAAATRLRLAGVYAFRPRWSAVARDLLTACSTTAAPASL
ncbi:phosphotransferase [Georgenia alba]|uniref:Phosphotransferase n=1 Tax=Georgenia alba TaxID=2233858 RepID=A0ABW2Q8W4_9MICO